MDDIYVWHTFEAEFVRHRWLAITFLPPQLLVKCPTGHLERNLRHTRRGSNQLEYGVNKDSYNVYL
jgi:hypothetical protein